MVQGVPDENKPQKDALSETTPDSQADDSQQSVDVSQGTREYMIEPANNGHEASTPSSTSDTESATEATVSETTPPTSKPSQPDVATSKKPPVKTPPVSSDSGKKLASSSVKTTSKPTLRRPAEQKPAGTLYLLSYLLWEREGVQTFENMRAQLLDTISQLIEKLRAITDSGEQIKHVILGGQTVLIEDIAAVRSDLVALLSIYNAGGRFGIGPWYVQVDSLLVSGESLVRNLLLGRNDVTRHGIELMDVAFVPSLVDHTPQLPQILAGFDITALMITSPQETLALPVRWVAPDGSYILVMNHHDNEDIEVAIDNQKFVQPDGPFVWLNPIHHEGEITLPDLTDTVKMPILQSTLRDYIQALRASLPDQFRPALNDKLSLLGAGYQAGRFSTRLYLKQANQRLQTLLTSQTEPWLAIALTNGNLKSPMNLRALLDYSWRELMKNQSRNNLTGCSDDTVTQETEIRNQRIFDVTQRIQDMSLDALPGTLMRTISPSKRNVSTTETYIGVWNSHSYTVEQFVEINLILPDGKYPEALLDSQGEELNFSWVEGENASDYNCRIGFRAKVSSVGYHVYTVKLSDKRPTHAEIKTAKGKAIAKSDGETLLIERGQLVWSRPKECISDFVSFHDGGDAGDTYNYRKPQPDVVVRAGMTDMINVESAPTYERLIFRERMRIASQLQDDLSRSRGLSLLDLTTTATFYDGVPGIYFRTTFTNKAQDHRLRAHVMTHAKADHIMTDLAYGITRHQINRDGAKVILNPQTNIFPLQTFAAVKGATETTVLMTRGLTEVEAIIEQENVQLALTLLRSVGWLKRDKDGTGGIAVRGAQVERDISAEYAILPMTDATPTAMMRASQAYAAPLQVFQYHEKPDPIQHSYLTFDSDDALMTALKPPQTGNGWIVRLLNPTDKQVTGTFTTSGKLSSVKLVNLAEEEQAEYNITDNKVSVKIAPQKIHTLLVNFAQTRS